MTLSLDTNVFVELIRGSNRDVRYRFRAARAVDEALVASMIVFHELIFGAELHHRREAQLASVREVLTGVSVQAFDEADMISAAAIRLKLRHSGLPIGSYDLLIAGQALAKGWTVVTANVREFSRIEGLKIIDWTAPAD